MTRPSLALRRTAAVAVVLLTAAGCGVGVSPPTEPVTTDRAAGSWKAADCKASLDIARDGTVRFADFPYQEHMSDDNRVRRMSGEGSWTFDENADGATTLDFKVDQTTRPLRFAVRNGDGKLVIIHLVGDPDNYEERCVFTRRDGAADGPVG